jgi:3-methyladenine DNA glycosylase AlkD
MTMTIHQVKQTLLSYSDKALAAAKPIFFKNCKDDVFLGVRAEAIRKIAKEFHNLDFVEIAELLQSNVHEERSLGNAILCYKYRKANENQKEAIFNFYIQHRHHIKDWNGVDDSAPYIVGPYLLKKDKDLLYKLVCSTVIWDRRIAIVATWWFIRNNRFEDTLNLAEFLLQDEEDLIHKAVGWMLREVGKRDVVLLKQFLDKHHQHMPRTMLRYAIEKFPAENRQEYLIRKKVD